MDTWKDLLASGKPGEEEARLRRFDGEYRWFLFRCVPALDAQGKALRWYGTNTDIEDRKRAESLLAAEKETLEMMANGAGLHEILDHLCRAIDAQSPEIMSTVLLMDPDGKRLWPVAGPRIPSSWTQAITPLTIGPSVGSCGTAAYLKKQVIVSDVVNDPLCVDFRNAALSHGLRASWSQPLLSRNHEVLGTFALYYHEPRVPTASDIQLIERAAQVALIAIESDLLQAALTTASDEIKKSEAQLRTIINAIPAMAWTALPDGTVDFLSQRWLEYYGLTLQDAQASGWSRLVHPEDVAGIQDQWRTAVAAGNPYEYEVRALQPNGEYRWCLSRAVPLHNGRGEIIKWYGTTTDIEDRKQIEEKLRNDERELRQITNAIPQIIVALSPDGSTLYANQLALEYTGLTLEEFQAAEFRTRIFHPDDVERLREERRNGLALGQPFELEQRALRHDGQYRWFLIRYNSLRDEQGRVIRWYATATDIEDRKQAEERVKNENLALREEIDRSSMFEEIVGSSEPLRRLLVQVAKVAPMDSTVLILGETGTGKELIARAIHKRSNRSARAFIRVNCAAIPPSLIASELFGHEKGAFTGAMQRRLGRFESADGGTLFLDEIGELPAETQIALLRVLQEREFERVGSSRPISVDVRVLAATNRDLRAAVEAGAFRQDLFYRLNVFPLQMPSLRERVDDIPLLLEYLIERYAKRAGKKITNIKKKTLELFQAYDWPGNIRELQNVVERAVVLCDGETFSIDETWLKGEVPRESSRPNETARKLGRLQPAREKEIIEASLAESGGRISGPAGAASKLGIPRQTLESKIRSLGIDKYRLRRG
jgi:formate hydrogenlyase transcriptional activator